MKIDIRKIYDENRDEEKYIGKIKLLIEVIMPPKELYEDKNVDIDKIVKQQIKESFTGLFYQEIVDRLYDYYDVLQLNDIDLIREVKKIIDKKFEI